MMLNKLVLLAQLFIFSLIYLGSAEQTAFAHKTSLQYQQYRQNILWEKYLHEGIATEDVQRKKACYEAAFNEAEKYFSRNQLEQALTNESIRWDLITLCGFQTDDYSKSFVDTLEANKENGLLMAIAGLNHQRKNGAKEQIIRKRIIELYKNAFGPHDKQTVEAIDNYQKWQSQLSKLNNLPSTILDDIQKDPQKK